VCDPRLQHFFKVTLRPKRLPTPGLRPQNHNLSYWSVHISRSLHIQHCSQQMTPICQV